MNDLKPQHLDTLSPIALKLLSLAKQAGADAAEVDLSVGQGFNVSLYNGQLQSLENSDEQALSLTVYKNQATGSVETTHLSMDALPDLVSRAMDLAAFTQPDPFNDLVDPNELAREYPDLDLYHTANLSAREAIATVEPLYAITKQQDSRIQHMDSADLSVDLNTILYANSNDFLGHYRYSRYGLSCQVIAEDGNGKQCQSDYAIDCHPDVLKDPTRVAKSAAKKACALLGARKVKTQVCPVIFQSQCASGLLATLLSATSGSAQYRKSSFLLDQVGQPVASAMLNIIQKPHVPRVLASCPFDSEGAKTRELSIIENGQLKTYIMGGYSSRKLGLQTTGNAGGLFNVMVDHDDDDLNALLQEMGTGLLITDLMGQGINMVTGDYSRGATGFWVEKGEIQFPVNEVTVAGNLKSMLMGIRHIASDVDHRRNLKTGSILIDQMTLAGA